VTYEAKTNAPNTQLFPLLATHLKINKRQEHREESYISFGGIGGFVNTMAPQLFRC
jgi:hypothetical protein